MHRESAVTVTKGSFIIGIAILHKLSVLADVSGGRTPLCHTADRRVLFRQLVEPVVQNLQVLVGHAWVANGLGLGLGLSGTPGWPTAAGLATYEAVRSSTTRGIG